MSIVGTCSARLARYRAASTRPGQRGHTLDDPHTDHRRRTGAAGAIRPYQHNEVSLPSQRAAAAALGRPSECVHHRVRRLLYGPRLVSLAADPGATLAIELRSRQSHPYRRGFSRPRLRAVHACSPRCCGATTRRPTSASPLRPERFSGIHLSRLPHRRRAGGSFRWSAGCSTSSRSSLRYPGRPVPRHGKRRPCGPRRRLAFAREGVKAAARSSCGSPPPPPPPPRPESSLSAGPRLASLRASSSSPHGDHRPGRVSGFRGFGRGLRRAFLSSSAFLLGMLAATLTGQYPFWLRSTVDSSYSLTALNSASDHYGLPSR